ncbi:putative Ig domain-containing protein [Dolichospermum heterosporum]|uniref:putative Ig domain-containing protein n=1 Tax=Dolichospermum heterosporum TaxID=747522 RepID=UPI003529742C
MASQNIIISAAAGNSFYQYGSKPGLAYPAIDPNVIAVGAVWAHNSGTQKNFVGGAIDYTTTADQIASFSQRDPNLLDVFAPGILITGANASGGTTSMGGTSQATAYMTGVATLTQQIAEEKLGRKLTVNEFRNLLDTNSVIINDGDNENDNVTNTGKNYPRVDLLKLAEGILNLSGSTSNPNPVNPGNNNNNGVTTIFDNTINLVHTVNLTAGEVRTGIDFGNQQIIVNHPPTVTNLIANQMATEDTAFSFTIPENTFTDIDAGDVLTYSATLENGNTLPNWLTFNPTTQTFSGTPSNDNVGSLNIKAIATDKAGANVSDIFVIAVENINDAPVLSNAIADQNAKQDNLFNFQIPTNTFSDIDAGDFLTYSATLENGNALPSWLTFDSTTRTISGTPTNDNVGNLNVKVTATDKAGTSANDIFAIAVENVNDAPILSNAIADQNAKQGTAFNFQIPTNTFSDIDAGDVLTYSATLENGNALPSWLTFNPTTRTFSGTPSNDNVGSLNVKVTATDKAGTSANDIFAIAVEKIIDNQSTTVGTPGDDKLIATPGSQFDGQNNIVFTGAGKDEVDLSTVSVFPNSGNNIVDLGSGEDTIFVNKGDRVFGSDGNDTFDARDGQGGNRISGGVGDDTFYLGSNDRALGGDGNDIFRVSLGGGNLISGGAGADQFWIVNAELPSSANTVLDFQLGTDVIGIQGAVSLGITTSTLKLNQVGADTAIVFNNQTLATLTGIQASSLNLTDSKQFVFA